MNNSSFTTITLKPRSGKRVKSGHPWIFSNEIFPLQHKIEPGDFVTVHDDSNRFIGYATCNTHSLIALRILSRVPEEIPGSIEWFEEKIKDTYEFRKRIYPHRNSYRLVFAESDNLPGVVVDRYGSILSVQILTAGMEKLKSKLLEALKNVMVPEGIVLRNDAEKRSLEGLPLYTSIPFGNVDVTEIDENGLRLCVDVKEGQKTGHFFDQADNRLALARFAHNAEVLDLFCYTGAWSLKLLQAGAKKAVAIDSSKSAIGLARKNAELNELSSHVECVEANAFDWLSEARQQKNRFDIVVVDPPAFAKTSKQAKKALRGYEDLNRQAIHLVRDRGILCTCSCSYHIGEEEFLQAIRNAAARERKWIRILEIRGQAQDHPILLSMPESRYLKCMIGIVENV